jgi:hypothetical protein
MYTTLMLTIMSKCKVWYVDATFKAVQRPFTQLFSVHGFVKQDDHIKQIPLCFVMMSRRSTEDYLAVMKYLRDVMENSRLKSVVLDFEAAVWRAITEVFPHVILRGCSFHWRQALVRKISELGLAPTYRKKRNTHQFMKQILCLNYLPHEQIEAIFTSLRQLVLPTHPLALHNFMQYIEDTWISSSVFKPQKWSVCGHAIRTNNDVEGWHARLNRLIGRCGLSSNVNMYELINILFEESKVINLQCKLVGDKKLQKYQKKKFKNHQQHIFQLWGI